MGSWADFFVAELGAAAALAGLVIVGISINVSRILAHPRLPGRAAETLVTPTGVLVVASCALVPVQPMSLLGGELVLTGAVMCLLPLAIQLRATRQPGPGRVWPRAVLSLAASLPFVAGGVLMLLGVSDALYWIVPGVVLSLVATVLNAWVLLIEILR